MACVQMNRVYPNTPKGIFVQWDYTPDANVAGPFTFKVERSGSPDGEWLEIASLPDGINTYDAIVGTGTAIAPNLYSIMRSLWYRVTVTTPSGDSTTADPMNIDGERAKDTAQTARKVNNLHHRQLLLRRKIIRDENLAFRVLNGISLAILKRRHFGTRCPICYDALTKMTTKARCPNCFGTSWAGGYYPPIITLGKINPSPAQVTLTNEGRTEINATTIMLLNYPRVEESDIIVEVETNTRWIVKQISPTELRRITVHQMLQVVELPKGAPEFLIPAEETT